MLSSCALVCSLACLVNSSSFIWPSSFSSKSKSAACGEGGAGLGGSGLCGAIGDFSRDSSRSKALGAYPIPFNWSSQVLLANLTLTFLDPYIFLDLVSLIVRSCKLLVYRVRECVYAVVRACAVGTKPGKEVCPPTA